MATTSNNDRSNVIRSWQLYSDSRADKARTREKKEKRKMGVYGADKSR